MAPNTETLPEGTDTIIPGASATEADDLQNATEVSDTAEPGRAQTAIRKLGGQLGEKTADLRGQAVDKAREFADQGKDKTVAALDSVVKLVDEAAGKLDEKVGAQFGDYARRAAEGVSGLASTLREKDVDALFDDMRQAVRKSPAIAIGAAAAVGFLLARAIKSGTATKTAESASPQRGDGSAA